MHTLIDKGQMLARVILSNLTVNVKNTIYSNMDALFISLGVIRSFWKMYIESCLLR